MRRAAMVVLIVPLALLALPQTLAQPAAQSEGEPTEPGAGTKIVHPMNGAIMVYVPSGYFTMGVDAAEAQAFAESLGYKHYHEIAAEEWFPPRRVLVPGYFVDQHEVTNERWQQFVAATGLKSKMAKGPPAAAEGKMRMYPAVQVSWAEAQRYANWATKALPSEAQWEKAARHGRQALPWGNEPLTPERGVFPSDKNGVTSYRTVGGRPAGASPYGCMDMAGNVYEWTSEWFEPYPNNPERERLLSYTGHQNGVLRGGSFYHALHALHAAKRFGLRPDEANYHVGFRTVWTPLAGYFHSQAFMDAHAKVAQREAELEAMRKSDLQEPPAGWSG